MGEQSPSGETVGERIRRLRLKRSMSLKRLAVPGVSEAYVSRIERGDRPATISALTILAPRLGVTVDYLQTGEIIPPEARRELRVADAELELRLGGDEAKAEAVLRQEVDEPVTEHALVARAQAGLALIAARRGDHQEAAQLFEAAIARGHLPPELRPDLYETLAACHVADRRAIVAIRVLERCLDEVRERAPADVALQARFGLALATAQSALGATDLARVALAQATEAARAPLVAQARTRVWWAQAGKAWAAGDTASALMLMRRASGLLEAGEDALRLGRAHLAAARLVNLDERYDEADPHLARAEALLTLGADPSDTALLCAEQAKVAAARGDSERAVALAAEAAALLDDDSRDRANAWHALAVAHEAVGDTSDAERHFKLALDRLTADRQWRQAAQVARQWARLLRRLERPDEAFRMMEEATILAMRGLGQEAGRARDAR